MTYLIRVESLQAFEEGGTELGRLVAVDLAHGAPARGELGIEDNATLFQVQLAEVLLGAAAAVGARRVDLVVSELLEDIKDRGAILQVMHTRLIGTFAVSLRLRYGIGGVRARKGDNVPSLPKVIAPKTIFNSDLGCAILAIVGAGWVSRLKFQWELRDLSCLRTK